MRGVKTALVMWIVSTCPMMAVAQIAHDSAGAPVLDGLKADLARTDSKAPVPVDAASDQIWGVVNGKMVIHFHDQVLNSLGVSLVDVQETAEPPDASIMIMEPPYLAFAIESNSDMRVMAGQGVFDRIQSGAVHFAGGFTLESAWGRVEMTELSAMGGKNLVSKLVGDGALALISGPLATSVPFGLKPGLVDVDSRLGTFILGGMDMTLSEVAAERLGHPEAAGRTIANVLIMANLGMLYEGVSREPVASSASPRANEFDVKLGQLYGMAAAGRLGTVNGCSMSTTSCNVGMQDVPWRAAMQEDHPGIHMRLYRVMDDRFEQIGTSWIKHGFFALSNNQCTPCQHPSNGTFLGVGCSDTYGFSNNADRSWLGPPGEWDASKGLWTCMGSHFDGTPVDCVRSHSTGHDAIQHRLRVDDSDLGLADADYYYEAFYLVRSEINNVNNVGYKPVTMTWSGTEWTFNSTPFNTPPKEGPAILDGLVWGDGRTWVQGTEGDFIVGYKIVDLGGGDYRYVYAVQNWTFDPAFQTFRVPVAAGLNVQDIGFRVVEDAELYLTNDWAGSYDGGAEEVIWETGLFTDDPDHNALHWGNTYTFWFTVDSPPTLGSVLLDVFDPGVGGVQSAEVKIPQAPSLNCPNTCGDLSGDSLVDLIDFLTFAGCVGMDPASSQDCYCSDMNGDNAIDLSDFLLFSGVFSSGSTVSPPDCL